MVEATALDGSRVSLPTAEISALREDLRGSVLLAADKDYEEARRVWNGNVDRRPGLIARCVNTGDVQKVARFASRLGLAVGPRRWPQRPGYGTTTAASCLTCRR